MRCCGVFPVWPVGRWCADDADNVVVAGDVVGGAGDADGGVVWVMQWAIASLVVPMARVV